MPGWIKGNIKYAKDTSHPDTAKWLKETSYTHILLVTILLSTVLLNQFVNVSTLSYIAGTRHLGPSLRESIYEQMGNYRDSGHKVYYLKGYPIVNDNATMLMRTNERGTTCGEEAQVDATALTSIEKTVGSIVNHCKNKDHITVFMLSQSKPVVDKLIAENPSYAQTISFEYISINPPK